MINKELQRKCAKCGVTALEDSSLSFHRFPLPSQRGSLKARVWAQYCYPDRDWSSDESLKYLYNQHKTLCSKHFDDSSYTSSAKSRLNSFAIPFEARSLLKRLKDELVGKVPQFNELTCPSREECGLTSTEATCSPLWAQQSAKNVVGTSIEMLQKKPTVHTTNETAQQLDIAAVEEGEVPNYTPKENVFSWDVTSDAVSIQDEPEQLDDDRDDLSMYCDDDAAKYINITGTRACSAASWTCARPVSLMEHMHNTTCCVCPDLDLLPRLSQFWRGYENF